jgi:hypothetical protein
VLFHPPWKPPVEGAPVPELLGPFAVLLRHAEQDGLALVGQVADAATAAVTRIEAGHGRSEVALSWPLAGEDVLFAGTHRAWAWPQAGALGPGPAIAALAALRRWAHDQAESGVTLPEVVQKVLGCGRSIALAAIAVDVLSNNPEQLDDELDPVLAQLTLWSMPFTSGRHLIHALQGIVRQASPERQDAYRRIGQRLRAAYEETARLPAALEEMDRGRENTVETVAAMLDASNYRLVTGPGGYSVLVNEEVVRLRAQ